ncbi:MAG TPA: NAD(P)-dependent oxidoreductase [Pyrinomonadaceae bacterium]|nr:NAD(P)-dependent oxidoreductase [Pyrinomonadaceae bacterium]
MSKLSIEQIEENFGDIHPALTPAEAAVEANRCLFCFDAPCMHACPTHIDIPGFIKKIASGNLKGSARVIFDANPVGATCARVCPVEVLCEGACVENTLLQKPIEIGRLQRYATDFAVANDIRLFEAGEPNGKSVGIIGSGPAGLSCATYLARLGYAVTIYEKRLLAGGLDTYGMAEYKMRRSVSLDEVAMAENLGVEFVLDTEIVREAGVNDSIAFTDLQRRHDAIFIGTGLGSTNKLDIPGEELDGVHDALHFIEKIKTRDWSSVPVGKTVVVIGAGNTAVDAATQAKRLGAERVIMVYRRTEKDASAYDYEMELARKDGVEFVWQAAPVGILEGENGNRLALRCERTDGSLELFEIPCDIIIKAVGQQKMRGFFEKIAGVDVDERGRVIVGASMQTSDPGIFAGGDCVNGGGEAVEAAQMGKLAAQGIHETLTGENVQFAGANIASINPSIHAD